MNTASDDQQRSGLSTAEAQQRLAASGYNELVRLQRAESAETAQVMAHRRRRVA